MSVRPPLAPFVRRRLVGPVRVRLSGREQMFYTPPIDDEVALAPVRLARTAGQRVLGLLLAPLDD